MLDEVLDRVKGLSPEQKKSAWDDALTLTRDMPWVPNPGPQTDAYLSEADVLLFGGRAGGGKALAVDTPIPTPFGWTTMQDVKIGDAIYDEQGYPCSVIAKSNVLFDTTYKLICSDGTSIIAGGNHQWVTRSYLQRMRSWQCSEER